MNRRILGVVAALVVAPGSLFLRSSVAWASSADDEFSNAQTELASVDRESASVSGAIQSVQAQKLTPEERLANGELLYRSKDYDRASVVLSEIIEEYPDTPSYPDALWLRAETYYDSHEYLAARRDYRVLMNRGTEPRFNSYLARALARLVDVSMRVGDLKALDEIFAHMNQVPAGQADAGSITPREKRITRAPITRMHRPRSSVSPMARRIPIKRGISRA